MRPFFLFRKGDMTYRQARVLLLLHDENHISKVAQWRSKQQDVSGAALDINAGRWASRKSGSVVDHGGWIRICGRCSGRSGGDEGADPGTDGEKRGGLRLSIGRCKTGPLGC